MATIKLKQIGSPIRRHHTQRETLNPMEEAAGLQRLVDEFKMTHEQAADAVGRSRSATTNLLRLLKLARPVLAAIQSRRVSLRKND